MIGTNGSGKTTFIKLLLGLLKPTNGTIHLNGINTKKISVLKDFVAYLPENAKLILLGPTVRKDFQRTGIEENIIDEIKVDLNEEDISIEAIDISFIELILPYNVFHVYQQVEILINVYDQNRNIIPRDMIYIQWEVA
ncbi:ATP-binding cassette domain-containing protein, partial [Candidatus Hodarchaeum mangrovi]